MFDLTTARGDTYSISDRFKRSLMVAMATTLSLSSGEAFAGGKQQIISHVQQAVAPSLFGNQAKSQLQQMEVQNSVYIVWTLNGKPAGLGSGSIIAHSADKGGYNKILTAAHVVQPYLEKAGNAQSENVFLSLVASAHNNIGLEIYDNHGNKLGSGKIDYANWSELYASHRGMVENDMAVVSIDPVDPVAYKSISGAELAKESPTDIFELNVTDKTKFNFMSGCSGSGIYDENGHIIGVAAVTINLKAFNLDGHSYLDAIKKLESESRSSDAVIESKHQSVMSDDEKLYATGASTLMVSPLIFNNEAIRALNHDPDDIEVSPDYDITKHDYTVTGYPVAMPMIYTHLQATPLDNKQIDAIDQNTRISNAVSGVSQIYESAFKTALTHPSR